MGGDILYNWDRYIGEYTKLKGRGGREMYIFWGEKRDNNKIENVGEYGHNTHTHTHTHAHKGSNWGKDTLCKDFFLKFIRQPVGADMRAIAALRLYV